MSVDIKKRRQELIETAAFALSGNVLFLAKLAKLVKANASLTTRMLVTDELSYAGVLNAAQFKYVVSLALGHSGFDELGEVDGGNRLRQTMLLGDMDRLTADDWEGRTEVKRAFLWRAIDVLTLTADEPPTATIRSFGAKLTPGASIRSAGQLREEVLAAVRSNPLLVDRLVENGDVSSVQFFDAMKTVGGDGLFGELAASQKGLRTLRVAFQNAGSEMDAIGATVGELDKSGIREAKRVAKLIDTLAKLQADLARNADDKGVSSMTRKLLTGDTRPAGEKKIRILAELQQSGERMFSDRKDVVAWLSERGEVQPTVVVSAIAVAGGMSTAAQLARSTSGAGLLRTLGNQLREIELHGEPLGRVDSGLKSESRATVPEL